MRYVGGETEGRAGGREGQAGGRYLAMRFMTAGERVDDEEKRHGELMRGGEERRVPQQEREGEWR